MISICIPVYNTDITNLVVELKKQLSASFAVFEILILDDASTITVKLESFPELRLLKNEQNQGRHKSRIILASKAAFENILFLDADVFPASGSFIKTYLNHCASNYDFIYGGVLYQKNPPEDNKILRWKYGRQHESRSVANRRKDFYQSLISMGFMVKKEVFINLRIDNNFNYYGQDIYISYLIQKGNYRITHIDNPVIHLGLEDNCKYLNKIYESLKFTWLLESKKLIPEDFRPVQRAVLILEKFYLKTIFLSVMRLFKKPIENNLLSSRPNMILLDLNKLYFYTSLKKSI
ncbi:Glycosyltransferase involved in cell wall bisynthesis [Nonlabens sp. Hel1_33_55]|uniref:glycosyltransferase family 2 protein n=1 Tax=Nonlabens sp. Hel1_33_55 TaxID=1336802 RepID=UPI000875C33F|nr:glycosyltransferase [Nonlabens sp. Hel1_33_55]SCX87279.1 Glycosyltransferase involved in cell wall bisynthesis [Nonlabens sp. Hel1_33_55]